MTESAAAALLHETPPSTLTVERVTAFLHENPAFLPYHVADRLRDTLENLLAENPSLIAELELPYPPDGVTSLPHVQLRLWRERLSRQEHTITQLHATAENNARLDQIMHDFAVALLGSEQHTPARLCSIIHDHFAVDAIRVLPLADLQADQIAPLQGWLTSDNPYCGRLSDTQRRVLFGEDLPETGSAALIALTTRPGTRFVLALGRHAPDGFNPSQGSLFLKQIGQLAETFLDEPSAP